MNIRVCITILAAAGLLFYGCQKNRDAEDQRPTWSTDAPLTVPYRVRLQRIEKANLVRNHSFETGRTFTLDSTKSSFVVDGWQQIGRHVEWVDIRNDSLYKANEAFSGNRAIKIVRKTAYETDEQGEGILSDFIKVIPGNYHLSLYARLEQVFPLRSRLGTRMFDGVEINLLYFDRNKIPVKPNLNFPFQNQVINTSFKSLSFANYNSIASFDWGKIIGKSDHFPFPDGDIPSEAHYVKIFIGLKASGTMWIDSVNFNYTYRNFSISERMQLFTDTTYRTPQAFIPTPKKLTRMASVIFYKADSKPDQLPLIVIPANADAFILDISRSIQDAFQQSIENHKLNDQNRPVIRQSTTCTEEQLKESSLIISIGNTGMYKKYLDVLPLSQINDRPQGYFIHTPADAPNLIILGANNNTGLFYSMLTLRQMIDAKQPVFHNARVVDYPDFNYRFYTVGNLGSPAEAKRQAEFARELIGYKINGAFSLSDKLHHSVASEELHNQLSLMERNDLFSLIRLPQFNTPNDSMLSYPYPVSLLRNGSQLQKPANDYTPFMISGLKEYAYLMIPPAFHNQLLDNSDFVSQSLPLDKQVKCIYSGSSFYSVNTDDADIERFSAFTNPKPLFMDNSMRISSPESQYGGSSRYYPGKLRLYNIFEPYTNAEIRDHFSKLDSISFFINQPVSGEIGLIRLATAADFLWNSRTYSRDYALWKVLMSRYGSANARELILYSDKYGQMLEILLRLNMKIQITRNFKSGQQLMADLTILVAGIGERLGSQHILVKELQLLNAGLRNNLNSYSSAGVLKN